MAWFFRKQDGLYLGLVGVLFLAQASQSSAVGFDSDDFIVSVVTSGNEPGLLVLDHNFTLKGVLGPDGVSDGPAYGIDFDASGRVVARGVFDRRVSQILVFEPDGSLAEDRPRDVPSPRWAINLSVAPNGHYYLAAQDQDPLSANGLVEITPDGEVLRQIDTGDYDGVAVLPNDIVVGGGGSGRGFFKAFRASTGEELFALFERTTLRPPTIPIFDQDQRNATDIDYNARFETLLMADREESSIYERRTDGTFVRRFILPIDAGTEQSDGPFGVTRGPGGDVFATYRNTVVRWNAQGQLLESVLIPGLELSLSTAFSILWAGNAPGLSFVEGDYNGDGFVSQPDLDLVLLNWGDDLVPDGWVAPDLFDGSMSQNELDAVLLNWGDGSPPTPTPVPEPAAGLVLGTALLALRRRDPRS